MPDPRPGETEEEFIRRCVEQVLQDGTTDDRDQAVAICYSIWRRSRPESTNNDSEGGNEQ